ncbi:hypothetical protein CY34DRAFT_801778 [Suillus luteus UH-Slu-Lm8-n1]|uniref:Uncharacterized protein n=1 Tax=Suillus luteus UH-Slu-Lm8-n1 TaxID=930992 RepID=A0A0D0B5X9_9AGAM|nr:hypothetical protein CY34DRAFT_801778 [Suillus luteus UH-Slu-Lm8-n1]
MVYILRAACQETLTPSHSHDQGHRESRFDGMVTCNSVALRVYASTEEAQRTAPTSTTSMPVSPRAYGALQRPCSSHEAS